jgi:eukaryotic-like serine/threonine-protein kinase
MAQSQPRILAGRYQLVDRIGRGGMGTVWRARDELLGRDVAVKEVLLPPGLDEEQLAMARDRTLREARAAAKVRHPAVVSIHDVVIEDAHPWIVMEYVESRSLDDLCAERGPLPVEETARIGGALLRALRVIHGKGVLHRDIKPANILLSEDGRVVLTDFGIATIEGDAGLTASGVLVGTAGFMAPERLRGRPAGAPSDLWSLGAVLYRMVEGRAPFEGESPMVISASVLIGTMLPMRRSGPLEPVIRGLMATEPAERWDARVAGDQLASLTDTSVPAVPHEALTEAVGTTAPTPTEVAGHTPMAPTPTEAVERTPIPPTPTEVAGHTPMPSALTQAATHAPVPPTPTERVGGATQARRADRGDGGDGSGGWGAPARPPVHTSAPRVKNPWPARIALIAVPVAALAGIAAWWLSGTTHDKYPDGQTAPIASPCALLTSQQSEELLPKSTSTDMGDEEDDSAGKKVIRSTCSWQRPDHTGAKVDVSIASFSNANNASPYYNTSADVGQGPNKIAAPGIGNESSTSRSGTSKDVDVVFRRTRTVVHVTFHPIPEAPAGRPERNALKAARWVDQAIIQRR